MKRPPSLKIVFFGTAEIAVPALRALAASGHEVALVVTRPDTKKGRGLKLAASAVKIAARSLKLNLYQPQSLASAESRVPLKNLNPDLFIVVAFGLMLKREVLEIPRLYCLNLHPSLLPKYRGAAPVNWAIINGGKATGVTVFRMVERMDAGDIIRQQKVAIKNRETAAELNRRLAEIGSGLLLRALDLIAEGRVRFIRQDEQRASFAPRLTKKQGNIDWSRAAPEIAALIQGLVPWPGAYTFWDKRRLKILRAHSITENHPQRRPGEIIGTGKSTIKVQTGAGCLVIDFLQPEGKRPMAAAEFLSGHPIRNGAAFNGSINL